MVVQVELAGFKSKFLRLLVARLAHNHVEQYPACRIFADHMVSSARERSLAMIKYFSPHLAEGSKAYATTRKYQKAYSEGGKKC
jgi:hypothetical protein